MQRYDGMAAFFCQAANLRRHRFFAGIEMVPDAVGLNAKETVLGAERTASDTGISIAWIIKFLKTY